MSSFAFHSENFILAQMMECGLEKALRCSGMLKLTEEERQKINRWLKCDWMDPLLEKEDELLGKI